MQVVGLKRLETHASLLPTIAIGLFAWNPLSRHRNMPVGLRYAN